MFKKIMGGKKKSKKSNKKTSSKEPIKKDNCYYFEDYPEFKPNLSPREIFFLGSFGGTYWREIKSKFFKKKLKNIHKKYPKSWWEGIPKDHLTRKFEDYDKTINKYKEKTGTPLEFWEDKGWIKESHPYGWVHWYCDFFMGKRCEDDERQIKRWKGIASTNGRFFRFLVTQINKKKSKWNDEDVSPKIRQVLQHWGYKLTRKDFNNEVKRRKEI